MSAGNNTRIKTILKSMISALDDGDDADFFACLEILMKLVVSACREVVRDTHDKPEP